MRNLSVTVLTAFAIAACLFSGDVVGQNLSNNKIKTLIVKKCTDFDVTGNGNNPEWGKTEWNVLTNLDTGIVDQESKFKILYSATGIYVLLTGKDSRITAAYDKDFENLYEGDV